MNLYFHNNLFYYYLRGSFGGMIFGEKKARGGVGCGVEVFKMSTKFFLSKNSRTVKKYTRTPIFYLLYSLIIFNHLIFFFL